MERYVIKEMVFFLFDFCMENLISYVPFFFVCLVRMKSLMHYAFRTGEITSISDLDALFSVLHYFGYMSVLWKSLSKLQDSLEITLATPAYKFVLSRKSNMSFEVKNIFCPENISKAKNYILPI